MKALPKIEFKIANLDSKIKEIIFILNNESNQDLKDKILNEYPILRKKLNEIENKIERERTIKKFFLHNQKENKGKIIKAQKNFQQTWDSMNEKFMTTILNILEINSLTEQITISVNISINPINSRNISSNEFDIYYKTNIREMKINLFNEILLLLYLKKWAKKFSSDNWEELTELQILEIIFKIVLNDPQIQKILPFKASINKKYETIFIDDNFLLNHIEIFYKEKTSFENFLTKTFNFIKKNKEKIITQLK